MDIFTARFARDAETAEPRDVGVGLCGLCSSRERSERALKIIIFEGVGNQNG